MNLLVLELSDAGILAASTHPSGLLDIDGHKRQSPGFAIPEKEHLLVGNAAAAKAHLVPLQVINTFWDRLSTEPLEKKNRHAQNQAEIACAHLSSIWENIKMYGDELVFVVPDHYGREQMGLILGMAQELSIPVKGFVSLPIAASRDPRPDALLMYLDIHLHRLEIVRLGQGEHLTRENSLSVQDIGLEQLYRTWVESVAEEFVRTTRFDPLHQAATEQEIYDRLPEALDIFKSHSSFIFEISQGKHNYRITLLRDLLIQKAGEVYDELCRFIEKMRDEHAQKDLLTVLQLSHRIASLPGLKDSLPISTLRTGHPFSRAAPGSRMNRTIPGLLPLKPPARQGRPMCSTMMQPIGSQKNLYLSALIAPCPEQQYSFRMGLRAYPGNIVQFNVKLKELS
jgi:hypothetical protein